MWFLGDVDIKKSKYILPSLFTSASLLFSFLAIVSAFQKDFTQCAYYILLAGFADAFDGKIARYTNTQTKFGAALDSLADVVSFGATPALVMYFWCLHSIGTLGVAISFFYMLAVALRLAKFDTQDVTGLSEDKLLEGKKYFYGMPCPAGAVTLSGLILMGVWIFGDGTTVTDYGLYIQTLVTSLTAIYISLMMVGDIKFRSFKDSDGEGHVSKLYIIGLLLILVMLLTMPEKLLYFIMIGYALSGPISHYQHIKSERKEK